MDKFYENKVKKMILFLENLEDAESIADLVTLRGQKCCVIKFQPIIHSVVLFYVLYIKNLYTV